MPLSALGRRLLPTYKAQLGFSTTLRRLTGPVRAAWAWAWPTLAAALQVQLGGRSLPSQWRWSRGSRPQAEVSSPPPGENPGPARLTSSAQGLGTLHAECGAQDPSLSSEKVVPARAPTQVPSHPPCRATETPKSARV